MSAKSLRPYLLALPFFLLFLPSWSPVQACDRSDLTLDSLVQVGNEYDVYLTLCVGGGRLGANQGADNFTGDFALGFYSCQDTVNFSNFTPSITSDTTGVTAVVSDVGPVAAAPFGTQGTLFFNSSGQQLMCVQNSNQCGLPHTQCWQLVIRMDVVPDSIRVFGIEGTSNPAGGCTGSDMVVDLSAQATSCTGDNDPPIITCPGPQVSSCLLGDYTLITTAVDSVDPNPVITQNPAPGSPIPNSPFTVTMTATDSSGNSSTCTISVTLNDTIAPTAICGTDTTYIGPFGNGFYNPSQLDSASFDNCSTNLTPSVSPPFTACGDVSEPHRVQLYVRCPGDGRPTGHAFIQLLPQTGPDAGRTDLYYGFTSALQSQGTDAPGIIAPDSPLPSDLCYTIAVSTDEYNAIVDSIQSSIANPPHHNLVNFNSVDWLESLFPANGPAFPAADFDSVSTPGALKSTLQPLPGAVAYGSTFPTGTSFPPDTSTSVHYDYQAIVEGAPSDPSTFATYFNTFLNSQQLAGVSLNIADSFTVNLLNVDLNLNTVAIDWGDGTIQHRQTTFKHRYSIGGLYRVNVVSLDTGALHHYFFDLFADITLPTSAQIFINTPAVPLNPNANPGLGLPNNPDSVLNLTPSMPLLTVADGQGNTDTCRARVFVLDTIPPTATCNDLTIQLDTSGIDTIFADQILASASDNCGVEYIGGNPLILTCDSLGTISYFLSAVDSSGNAGTCIGNITIVDTLPPNANCTPFTVYLDSTAMDSIEATDIAGSIDDNCGIQGFGTPMPNAFDCGDLGNNIVTLTITDNNNNTSTCTTTVIVMDTIPPQLDTCPGPQSLNPLPTACGAPATWNPPAAIDNCSLVQVTSNKNPGDFFSPGNTTVTYVATDPAGNQDSCSFVITILAPALATSTAPATYSNGTNILCNGTSTGSATTSPIGGCPPYSYLWSNGDTTLTATGLSPGWNAVSVTDQNNDVYVDSVFLIQPAPLSANIPAIQPVCEGDSTGTFLLSLAGGDTTGREFCVQLFFGATQFCYPENNSIVSAGPLPAGVHLAVLTDSSGCQWTDTITIDSVPNPQVDLGADTTICPGTSATLDAGNSGASFLWTTGQTSQVINPSQPQTIAVQVIDGNGCVGRDTVTVSQYAGPNTGISSNGPICQSEVLQLTGPAGNPSYLWTGPNGFQSTTQNNTIQPIHTAGPNTYFFTTTGPDGCVNNDSIVVTIFADPVIPLASDTTLCNGAVISLDAGNPGSLYQWSNSANTQTITTNSAGTYSVTVTSLDGCTDIDSIVVTTEVTPVATFNFVGAAGPLAFDFSDLSTGNPSSWLWDFGDGNSSTQQNPSHTYLLTATYTVCLTATGPCGTDSTCQSIAVTSSAAAPQPHDHPITVYPNPNDGHAWLRYNSPEPIEFVIFDARGKRVYVGGHAGPNPGEKAALDLSQLAAGLYHLKYATPTLSGSIRIHLTP